MSGLIDRARTQLLVIDVQERLLPAMSEPQPALANCMRLVQAAAHLSLPVTVSQQYPKGIGPTVEDLRRLLPNGAAVLDKLAFSCVRDEGLRARIEQLAAARARSGSGVRNRGARVRAANRDRDRRHGPFLLRGRRRDGLARARHRRTSQWRACRARASTIVTSEMAIFEWLGQAGTADFKALMPLVK